MEGMEEDDEAVEEGTLLSPVADEKAKKEESEYLKPLTGKLRHRDVAVYDVESKDGDSQEKGFTRPFMIWLHWEDEFGFQEHRVFRDSDEARRKDPLNVLRHFRCKGATLETDPGPNTSKYAADAMNGGLQAFVRCPGCADCLSKRHYGPGGCVDQFLRFVLAMDLCPSCQSDGGGRRWRSKTCMCKRLEKRFQQKPSRPSSRITNGSEGNRLGTKGTNIYAHNGGKFDHLFLLGWLREHRDTFSFEIASVQARIQRLDVWPRFKKKKEGFWSFLDSVSLLPMSLGKIGKTFCPDRTQKGKMPEADEWDERWDEYNRDDCVVLREGLLAFHRLIAQLGGEVGITAPATSMKLFRRRYMKKQWIFRNAHFHRCDDRCVAFFSSAGCERSSCEGRCHGCAHQWVRGGYYGGRTEMFQEWGPKGTSYYDVNSSYPASMLDDMPVGKMIEVDCSKMSTRHALLLLKKLRKTSIGFVECEVEIPKTCQIPPLPHRDENGKLTFETGFLSGTWDYDELALLDHPLVMGRILSIKKTVWYGKRAVFREMVDTVFEYRNKSREDYSEGLSFCAKLMLNSLYGKFGMREERSGLVCIGPGDPWPEHGIPIDGDHETCDIWEVERIVEASYIIPQISAHITSLSRIRLFLGLIAIVSAGGTILYGDSISGDRTVVVQDPQKRTHVIPIERLWRRFAKKDVRWDKKQLGALPGWKALARDGAGKEGWFSLGGIIRHRVHKEMWLVSNRRGQTEVTEDHGIISGGKAVTPAEFVDRQLVFEKIKAQPSLYVGKAIDLLEHLDESIMSRTVSGGGEKKYRFEPRGEWMRFKKGEDEPEPRDIRRIYRPNSKELHSLLRLLAAYLAEGSASLATRTTCRFVLSISQADETWLDVLKTDFSVIAPEYPIFGPYQTAGASVIRSGTAAMSFFFAGLCGFKSWGKRLPSFIYDLDEEDFQVFWQHMLDGDGSRIEKRKPSDANPRWIWRRQHIDEQRVTYTTISQELCAGLSYLLDQHGIEHGINYRPKKKCWSIATRPAGTERMGGKLKPGNVAKVERRVAKNEWVYDLNVPGAGTFVDGLGRVLLHNTDSSTCFFPKDSPAVDADGTFLGGPDMKIGSALGEWKREEPGILLDGDFILPKLYQLRAHKDDCVDPDCEGCRFVWHVPGCKGEEDKTCPGCAATKIRAKGVPYLSQTLVTWNRILPKDKGGKGEKVYFDRLGQHKSMLNKRHGTPGMTHTHKSIRTKYDKRILKPDGTTVPRHVPKKLPASTEPARKALGA